MKMKNVAVFAALAFTVGFIAVGCRPKPDGITYIRESDLKPPGPGEIGGPLSANPPQTATTNPPVVPPTTRPTNQVVVPPGGPLPPDPSVTTVPRPTATNPPPVVVTPTPTNVIAVDLPPARVPSGQYTRDMEKFSAQTVYFDFDKSAVKAEERAKVEIVATYLKANPDTKVEVEGHADERGTDQYNLSLSERRALAVRELLSALGVTPDRVTSLPLGESQPAVLGHNEEAWGKSRRGVFVLLVPKP